MATLPERSTAVLLYWARSAAAIKRSWARWTFAEAVIGSSSTIPPGPRNLGRSEPVTAVPLELARVERYGGAVREARSASGGWARISRRGSSWRWGLRRFPGL